MTWEFHPIAAFADWSASWAELNVRAGGSPILRTEFVEPLIEEFASGRQRLAVRREGGTVSAMCVLDPVGKFRWQTFQPANAPIGLWISDNPSRFTDDVAELLKALPGFPLLLGITQQDPAFLPRPAASGTFATADYIVTPKISITDRFEDYWARRGKNLRHNVKRQRNKLARDGVTTRLELLSEREDMARAVTDYSLLETTGWKGKSDSAVGTDDPQGRFYVKMLQRFADLGAARVYRYFYDDTLAASDICLLVDGVFIILKTAYNEAISGFSPAQLMRHEIFAELFDSGNCREIEFYGPLKEWHTKLTDEIRTMYHLNHFRSPIIAMLHTRRSRPQCVDAP